MIVYNSGRKDAKGADGAPAAEVGAAKNEATPARAAKPMAAAKPEFKYDKRATYIATVTARDADIKVMVDPEGGSSYANLETKEIVLSEKHNRDFVSAHEGAHIGETPSLRQLGKTPKDIEDYAKMVGFFALHNVVEDGAINDKFCRDFPELQEDTLESYPRVDPKSEIGFIQHPEVQVFTTLLGRPPLFAQALAGILADWSELRHTKGFAKSEEEYKQSPRLGGKCDDPRLQTFFDRALPKAREVIAMIPPPDGTNQQSFDCGVRRFTFCEKAIYPYLLPLIEQDKKDLERVVEEFDKLLKETLEKQQGEKQKDQQGKGGQQSQDHDGDAQEDPQSQGGDQGQDQDGEGQEGDDQEGSQSQGGKPSSKGQNGKGKPRQQGKQSKGKQKGAKGQDAEANDDVTEGDGQSGKPHGKSGTDPKKSNKGTGDKDGNEPHEAPSEGDKPRSGTSMSPEEARQRAKEILNQISDAIRGGLQSLKEKALNEAPTAEEVTAREKKAEQDKARAAEADARAAALGEALELSLIQSLTPYDREFRQLARDIDAAYNRLVLLFDPARSYTWQDNLPVGTHINLNRAMTFELTGRGHETLMRTRKRPQQPDQEHVIIIDRSGSMEMDKKFEYARKAVIFARELFQRLHIPTACVGFADSSETFIDFEADIADLPVKKALMDNTMPLNQGTNDERAVRYAANLLRERNALDQVIIMISDAGSGVADSLRKTVRELAKKGVPVLHFGIGEGTEDTQGLYIHSWGGLSLTDEGEKNFLTVFCREMERLAKRAIHSDLSKEAKE